MGNKNERMNGLGNERLTGQRRTVGPSHQMIDLSQRPEGVGTNPAGFTIVDAQQLAKDLNHIQAAGKVYRDPTRRR